MYTEVYEHWFIRVVAPLLKAPMFDQQSILVDAHATVPLLEKVVRDVITTHDKLLRAKVKEILTDAKLGEAGLV